VLELAGADGHAQLRTTKQKNHAKGNTVHMRAVPTAESIVLEAYRGRDGAELTSGDIAVLRVLAEIAIGDGPTQSVWNQTGRSRSLPLAFMEWRRPEWYDSAACRGKTDLFSSQHDTSKAKAICATCPVIVQCAEVAEDFGVWAGTSERDRRRGSGRRNALVLVAA
jgi:Transcription factor WhiB